MSATLARKKPGVRARRRFEGPRATDPRVVRTRAAVIDAARTLFLEKGYGGTTMEEIAALAGITKRTMYNNYPDKEALFMLIVADVTAFAEAFALSLPEEFTVGISATNLTSRLHEMGRRIVLAIARPQVIALRRLLVGESRDFPSLAADYYERAPGQVIEALATGFSHLARRRLLQVKDARRAAAQFAYLVAGDPLDRAMLTGTIPPQAQLIACAKEGVATFLARYRKRR